MKPKGAGKLPLTATGRVLTAAVTATLLPSSPLAAPGDLDPGFGDSGRVRPDFDGPARSVELLDDGTMVLGGGRTAVPYPFPFDLFRPFVSWSHGFVGVLTDSGATAAEFRAAEFERVQVFDVARQPDGQFVAVGRAHSVTTWRFSPVLENSQLVALRLQSDGSLDSTFAEDGVFALSDDDHGTWHRATSVVVDPDGRIVVAGTRGRKPIALRLLPDGSFDDSFGRSGFVVGTDATLSDPDIVRTEDGGYRLTSTGSAAGCQLVALTPSGAMDERFGNAGIATVGLPGTSTCSKLALQTDGRLVVVGAAAERAFAARLLPNGQLDPGFSAAAGTGVMNEATAVAIDAKGRIAVAGYGTNGGTVVRMTAGGAPDVAFGIAGSTLIDLYSEFGSSAVPYDVKIRPDGRIVIAGADALSGSAFVVSLAGESGVDSPGVLGIVESSVVRVYEGSEVALNVRRTGGSSGVVSVAYETSTTDWTPLADDADYTADAGRLTWADGDTSSQTVRFPVTADDAVEDAEYFAVRLSDVQGGAGLGTVKVVTEIAADGSPHGQLGLDDAGVLSVEEGGALQVGVSRQWYAKGEVSVTLTPTAKTASADVDFTASPVTLSWANGEMDRKYVTIPVVDDGEAEDAEEFRLELVNPTGGAVLASRSKVTVRISASDQPPAEPPPEPAAANDGGGGALGFLSLFLLGIASLFRMAAPTLECQRPRPGP